MSYLITLDLWGTIIGEKDYSSVSPKRSIKKCELIFDYVKEFSDTITLNDVSEALDFTVNKISLYSRFFCDKLFFMKNGKSNNPSGQNTKHLTDKQIRFAREYVYNDGSKTQTECAVDAGYAASSAAVRASE